MRNFTSSVGKRNGQDKKYGDSIKGLTIGDERKLDKSRILEVDLEMLWRQDLQESHLFTCCSIGTYVEKVDN
jgi:hypothetical protein